MVLKATSCLGRASGTWMLFGRNDLGTWRHTCMTKSGWARQGLILASSLAEKQQLHGHRPALCGRQRGGSRYVAQSAYPCRGPTSPVRVPLSPFMRSHTKAVPIGHEFREELKRPSAVARREQSESDTTGLLRRGLRAATRNAHCLEPRPPRFSRYRRLRAPKAQCAPPTLLRQEAVTPRTSYPHVHKGRKMNSERPRAR